MQKTFTEKDYLCTNILMTTTYEEDYVFIIDDSGHTAFLCWMQKQ